MVTVYVVVVVGLAIGFAIVGLSKPVVGLHKNKLPPAAFNCVLSPGQIILSEKSVAVKSAHGSAQVSTFTVISSVPIHPSDSVTTTV